MDAAYRTVADTYILSFGICIRMPRLLGRVDYRAVSVFHQFGTHDLETHDMIIMICLCNRADNEAGSEIYGKKAQ